MPAIPKRSNQRLSKDKSRNEAITKVNGVHVDKSLIDTLKHTNPNWCNTMRNWFTSLKNSGQSRFYQPSDWATARMWCDIMTKELAKEDGASAAIVSQFNIVASSLLTTEGARRKARLEILSPEVEEEVQDATETLDDEIDDILGI